MNWSCRNLTNGLKQKGSWQASRRQSRRNRQKTEVVQAGIPFIMVLLRLKSR
jgi:hypothetical protein